MSSSAGATKAKATVNIIAVLSGDYPISITAPVKGTAPQTTITEGTGYTGTISWSPTVSGSFAGDTVYTATVELTAKSGYQFASTATASVSGATISEKTVEADGSKLKFKAAFPATAGKETPTCVAPSGVTATYGQTLSDLALSNTSGNTPGAWSWMNGTQSVGNVGSNTHKAKFTPTDTANFLTVENIDVTVTVNAKNLSDVSIDNIDDQAYTGSPITPTVTVKGDSGKTLVKDTDYTVEYSDNTNKGTATVTVKAKSGGNYTFSNVTKNFNIVAAASTISITSDPSKTYDGAAVTDPAVNKTGSAGAVTYAYYKDADCTTQTSTADGAASNGAAPKNAGSYWVKASVAADANYGSATSAAKSFTISPKNISGANITLGTAPIYDGSEQSISISSVTLSGGPAITSGDYDITTGTDKATNVESKTLTIKGKGNFTGTATKTWSLQKATPTATDFSITTPVAKDYTGSPITVATPTLKSGKTGAGTITVKYGSSATAPTDVGSYTVTFDVNEGQNYKAATGLSIGTLTISKATYASSITANKNVKTSTALTGVEVDMSTKFGVIKGAAVKSATEGTDSDNIISNVSVSGNIVKFDVASIADANKTATINVVISCTNFNDITAVLTVKTVDKDEAGVTISGVPTTPKTYGDAEFTLTGAVTAAGTGTGNWTWETSDPTVLQVTGTGNTAKVKILKAGSATVTAKYESDTTVGQLTTANIRVNKATVTVAAKNQSIYVNGTVPNLTSPVKDTHYTVTGLVSGDTLGGTITMKYQKDGTDATPDATKTGTYNIVISGATAPTGGNYNNVVFTAGTLTISNKPSSGGGGGGGSTPITVPVSDPKNQVKVTVTVSGTTATVQKIDLSKIDQAQGVTIDFTGLGRTIESAKLPTSAIKEIGATESGALTVKLTAGSVTFDNAALKAVADQAGSQITLTLAPVKTSTLNASQKETVGDAPVFDLQLLSGSKAITDFKGGNVTVTLPHTLSKGQEPAGVVVYYLSNDGNPEACKTTYDAKSKLVTFTTTHFSLYFVGYKQPAAEWENPFTDVAEGAWYYDSIKYVYSNGMMVGIGDTKFSPDTTTTRGMIVTILYRLEGEPAVSGTSSFNDVAEGKYYANAVKWAAENEIVGGYGNGQFGPEDPITREQMAAILYRYAAFKGLDMTKTADLSKFTDSDQISDWAKFAMNWANAEGLINGKGGGILDPRGNATRAEVATILTNFCKTM